MLARPPRFLHILAVFTAITFTAFLSWLYYPALFIFFASDDWVLLSYVKDIPLSQSWRYLSPHTIWFYRPLQTLQYGLTYHLAGLNPAAYNAQLIIMYLTVPGLVWIFLRMLFGAGIATITAILFSVTSLATSVFLWKANFNTLHNAIITIAACCFYAKYLKTGNTRWYIATAIAAVANWFTKESAINLPLILATIWLTSYLQNRWTTHTDTKTTFTETNHTRLFRQFLKSALRDLWLFAVLALAYVALRQLFFVNIETRYEIIYHFVDPWDACKQIIRGTNHTIFSFLYDPILLNLAPGFQDNLAFAFIRHGYLMPLACILLGFWRKNPAIILSITFTIAAQVPTFMLQNYYESRYYYLPALGGSLFISSILWPMFQVTPHTAATPPPSSEPATSASHRIAGYTAAITVLWIFAGNIITVQQHITAVAQQSSQVERAFKYIRSAATRLPPGSAILIEGVTQNFLYNGFGAIEMVQFATRRNDLVGMTNETRKEFSSQNALSQWPNQYALDIKSTQLEFRPLK